MSALLSFVYKILAQSTKSREVTAITRISRKIQNRTKFESFPISAKFSKENYLHFIYNYKELSSAKLEFSGTLSENALFSKNSFQIS